MYIAQGSNKSESLHIPAEDFLFAESADNYLAIHYLKDGTTERVLSRMSIKMMSEQISGVPHLFRCHKFFMVNLARVTSVTGNAQGYKLQILSLACQVPVSRSLNVVIREKLLHLAVLGNGTVSH